MRKLVSVVAAIGLLAGTALVVGARVAAAATVVGAPEPVGAFDFPQTFDASDAYGVNATGQVVGHARSNGAFNDAFLYDTSSQSLRDLGEIGFGRQSTAFAVNSHGVAAGSSLRSDEVPDTDAVRWLPNVSSPQSLGSLGGLFGSAFGINDAGVIVGQSDLSDGTHHAFVWDPTTGAMSDIGVLPGGDNSTAYGIDDAGLVVGTSEIAGTGPCLDNPAATCRLTHAFTYDVHTQVLTDIGALPGGAASEARAVDGAGHLIGSSLVPPSPGSATTHPFVYDTASATFTDLGSLAGTVSDRAMAVNDDGVVVGDDLGTGGDAGAWVYDPATGSMTAAPDISELNGINDHGEMAGAGLVPPGLDEDGNPLPGTTTGAMHTQLVLPPGAPVADRATSCAGGVELIWSAPAFGGYAPAIAYQVRRNGTLVATVSARQWHDKSGGAGDSYTVTATDAAGSSPASAVAVASCADAIAGTVTSGGSPVAGIDVQIYPAGGHHVVVQTTTAPDGTYAATGLTPGNYQVRFTSPTAAYVEQWDGGAASQATAAPVAVTGGPAAIVDAALVAAGSIDGTVTDGVSPVGGIRVAAFVAGSSSVAGRATTASDGTYEMAGLTPGSYQVRFQSSTGAFVLQWDGGVATRDAAPPVVVVGAAETTVDAGLQVAGTITGQILLFDESTGGLDLAGGIVVRIMPATGKGTVAKVTTDNSGTFVAGALPPGDYVVQVTDPFGRFGGSWWYVDDGGDGTTTSRADATVVTAVGGKVVGIQSMSF